MSVCPARSTMSPACKPALAAGPSGTTMPMTGTVHGPIMPMRRKNCASTSAASKFWNTNTTSRVEAELSGLTSPASLLLTTSRRLRLFSAACISCQRRSSKERTLCKSSPSKPSERTNSWPRKPAFSATEPATGLAKTAFGSCRPLQFNTLYSIIANNRLAAGPAATTAARDFKGWVLKARCRSDGSTGPSRSSSIFT